MGVKVREKIKGSGDWYIFINHKGERMAKRVGRDKRQALEIAKQVEAKLALGDMNLLKEEPKIKTFGDYTQTWITTTVPATCKPSTEKDYRGILKNHILPVFGKVPVTKINRLRIKNFLRPIAVFPQVK